MKYELVYDAAATADAPRPTLTLAVLCLAAAALLGGWRVARGHAPHGAVVFLGGAGLLLLLVGAALAYDHRVHGAASAAPLVVEGPLTRLWRERDLRARDGAGLEWEGFTVAGVAFSYARNLEQPRFHNAPGHAVALREGLWLRLRYVEEHAGGRTRRHILRVERRIDDVGRS